ncbi:aminopeptidase P N-terminal domain-containing protein [Ferrimonas balearica]|uniref:aminopeptidase P N-terminal domain-containing protein n=1 Tax=Ferrimonas balearica TaxID=44012 RepID=UPI001C99528C|nr:aminopeptidase P N-terminal domain-containing protein [Ferrimonas balearica]MBY5993970.1 aminopeptidase P N-terminal domain-containing protein [Ferrimonas balearica]
MTHQARRRALCHQLDANCAVILAAAPQRTRSKNQPYRFVQDKDFLYFTGFDEPDAVAVIRPGHAEPFVLFCRPRDPEAETSFGARLGPQGVVDTLGADRGYPLAQLDEVLPTLLEGRTRVLLGDEEQRLTQRAWGWANQQRRSTKFDQRRHFRSLEPLAGVAHEMRVIKSETEIALLRHAVSAACDAHRVVMTHTAPGVNERQLSQAFNATLAHWGCESDPYPNIVAGGERALCLHYDCNDQPLLAGELLLIDAGAEYQGYASDITRTYPVSGRFSAPQRQLYELVLSALDAAIAEVAPGVPWGRLYDTACRVLTQGLLELGILEGELETLLDQQAHKRFSVHKTGHFLGLDVHDVGQYRQADGQWRPLAPGMVLTLEPGLYIPSDAEDLDPRWRGIAVRVEDDILVTHTGAENLSASAPRTVDELERLVGSQPITRSVHVPAHPHPELR